MHPDSWTESVQFSIRRSSSPPSVYILTVFHNQSSQNNGRLRYSPSRGTEVGCRYRHGNARFTTFAAIEYPERKSKYLYFSHDSGRLPDHQQANQSGSSFFQVHLKLDIHYTFHTELINFARRNVQQRNGGRYRARTCGPRRVRPVLYR